MVGIFVNHEIIAAATPAPIHAQRPLPRGNFEKVSTRQPETMQILIDADDVVAV
jgi:hypothetical protein